MTSRLPLLLVGCAIMTLDGCATQQGSPTRAPSSDSETRPSRPPNPEGAPTPDETTTTRDWFPWLLLEYVSVEYVLDFYPLADQVLLVASTPAATEDRCYSSYVLTQEGLDLDSRVLSGLGFRRPNPAILSIEGDWPRQGTLEFAQDQHPCPTPLQRYEWSNDSWTLVESLAPYSGFHSQCRWRQPFEAAFRGGRIYEKYDEPTGQSSFVLDPEGEQRATVQRRLAPPGCAGKTQLAGRFNGHAFGDGTLVGIGEDCRTGIVSAEYWRSRSTTSHLEPLPGEPRLGFGLQHRADEPPVTFIGSSTTPAYFGFFAKERPKPEEDFEEGDITHELYVGGYDGQRFINLSPPGRADYLHLMGLSDGSLVLATQLVDTPRLQLHPGLPAGRQAWRDITPTTCQLWGVSEPGEVFLDARGHLWAKGGTCVARWTGAEWETITLPRQDADDPDSRYRFRQLAWMPWGELVIVASGWEGNVLLRRRHPRHTGLLRPTPKQLCHY